MSNNNYPARALWIERPGEAGLREQRIEPPAEGEVTVKTLFSGISRGTERVVFTGAVPERERASMRAPFQEGDLPGPLKYGYSSVGRVEAGEPALQGRTVFCLYPHQSRYVVPREAVIALPAGVPPKRGLLAANMETAVNAAWDGGLTVGSRVVVVGAGIVGLLVAYLAGLVPGTSVAVIDTNPAKLAACRALGIEATGRPAFTPDIVFEASASQGGLQSALDIAGLETRIVVLSWFGDTPVELALGGAFHSKRLTIASSQVGHVAPDKRPRWSHRQRLGLAVSLLADARLDGLINGTTPFADLPARYERILLHADDTLCHAVDYADEP